MGPDVGHLRPLSTPQRAWLCSCMSLLLGGVGCCLEQVTCLHLKSLDIQAAGAVLLPPAKAAAAEPAAETCPLKCTSGWIVCKVLICPRASEQIGSRFHTAVRLYLEVLCHLLL